MTDPAPVDALLAALPTAVAARFAPARAELSRTLAAIHSRGIAARPQIVLDPVTLARELAPRWANETVPPRPEDLHAEDLYLACALGRGDADAIRAFERELFPVLVGMLRKRGLADDAIEDLQQTLHEYLLVGTSERPGRIADYRGHGPLRSWLTVSALRMARRAVGRERRKLAREADVWSRALVGDPEDHVLRTLYARQLTAACEHALTTLPRRERAVLRMHVIDAATIDAIGKVYGIHRATAARWLQRARATVLDAARRHLVQVRGIDANAVDAIMRLARSRLDVSVERLLRSDG